MTTTNKPAAGTFYDVPSWYQKPKLPKGQVGFGVIPPRKTHSNHHEMDHGVEGRRTLAGAGALLMLIVFLGVLLISTLAPTLLTNGLAFFGMK